MTGKLGTEVWQAAFEVTWTKLPCCVSLSGIEYNILWPEWIQASGAHNANASGTKPSVKVVQQGIMYMMDWVVKEFTIWVHMLEQSVLNGEGLF